MATEIILQPVKLTSTGTACREFLARGIRISAGVEHNLELVG